MGVTQCENTTDGGINMQPNLGIAAESCQIRQRIDAAFQLEIMLVAISTTCSQMHRNYIYFNLVRVNRVPIRAPRRSLLLLAREIFGKCDFAVVISSIQRITLQMGKARVMPY